MKNQKLKEMLHKKLVKAGSLMLAAALVMGGGAWYYNSQNQVPELTTFVDADGSIEIEEEEVPLAAPKVTKTTKTTKKTKKIKLKKASKKTYKQAGKTTTKKKTVTKRSSRETTKTETVTTSKITNQYKKGSKINSQLTTTKTVVTKTVTPVATKNTAGKPTANPSATTAAVQSGVISITQAAPGVKSNVSSAFQKLGFKIVVNPTVSYAGLCDARTRTITLKKADSTIYHELGHFVAFVAGNVDTTASFKEIYNREKSLYTANDKSYVLQDSSEYFAESFRNYTLAPNELKASRPQTYAAIDAAVAKVTDSQVSMILNVYGSFWNS